MQWPGEQKQPHFSPRMVGQAGHPAFNGRHQPLASTWQMIDNSKDEPRLIAAGIGRRASIVRDQPLWRKIKRSIQNEKRQIREPQAPGARDGGRGSRSKASCPQGAPRSQADGPPHRSVQGWRSSLDSCRRDSRAAGCGPLVPFLFQQDLDANMDVSNETPVRSSSSVQRENHSLLRVS